MEGEKMQHGNTELEIESYGILVMVWSISLDRV
jgi:hypothetical protein